MSARKPTKGRPAAPTKGPRKKTYTDKAKPPKKKRKTKASSSPARKAKGKRKTKAQAKPTRKAKTKRKAKRKTTKARGASRAPRTLTAKKRAAYLSSRECGSNKAQAAAAADIPRSTLYDALAADPDFAAEDLAATELGVHTVVNSLFGKATGSGRESVIAAIFWLKNRAGENWSDVKEVHVIERLMREERAKLSTALEAAGLTDEQLAKIDAILNGTDTADDAVVH